MKNIGQMMKQAQQLQEKMLDMQNKLAEMEVTGESGGGLVRVTLNGKSEARKVKIDPSLVSADEIEVLEDLLLAAFNDARAKVEAESQAKLAELTGGLQLPPGLKLPF
jgi:DNA-binding YbaB/EbfC family protein